VETPAQSSVSFSKGLFLAQLLFKALIFEQIL